MSRLLSDLSPAFRPLAIELLARCTEANVPVMIIDTLRTQQEQEKNVAKGVSWTLRSKHLTGLAIDICPYEEFKLNGPDKLAWNPDNQVWEVIGAIGESLGLTWGGRWKQRDLGHFELKWDPVTPPTLPTFSGPSTHST